MRSRPWAFVGSVVLSGVCVFRSGLSTPIRVSLIVAPDKDEYSQIALKFKALEREKANLTAQLATQQQAITQAKKLAEAKRKLARMQSEVEQLQKACGAQDAGQMEASRQPQVYNLRHESNPHQQ